MAQLIDYLPPDHYLRTLVRSEKAAAIPPPKVVFKHRVWAPIYLIKTRFINKHREYRTQELLGDKPQEIVAALEKSKFTPLELSDLMCGIPVESSDGKTQYTLATKYPEPLLGNVIIPHKKEDIVPELKPVMETGWGAKIRKYRIDAKFGQGELSKKITNAATNVLTSIENETRKFYAEERKAFFEAIGKPEDTTIPLADAKQLAHRAAAQKRLENQRNGILPKYDRKKKTEPEKEVPAKVEPHKSNTHPKHKVAKPVVALPPVLDISPIKQAAINETHAVLTNPKLSDKDITDLMSLFRSLTISILMRG